jgi:hypothetical protein
MIESMISDGADEPAILRAVRAATAPQQHESPRREGGLRRVLRFATRRG